jgi:hypothetical protein
MVKNIFSEDVDVDADYMQDDAHDCNDPKFRDE